MSKASERKRMVERSAGYALMGVPQIAKLLDCEADVVIEMMDAGTLPYAVVGKRRKADPIEVAVLILSGAEGAEAYWARWGDAGVVQNAKRFYTRAGLFVGAA